jgi:hypothetical protein
MWPAWHGNDQITFVGPEDQATFGKEENGKVQLLFDVVQYRLSAGDQSLEPVGTLSESWDDEMKPFTKVQPKPTTQP